MHSLRSMRNVSFVNGLLIILIDCRILAIANYNYHLDGLIDLVISLFENTVLELPET